MDIYEKLNSMGIDVSQKVVKGGLYKPVIIKNNIAYVSGQGSTKNGIPVFSGKLGDLTIEEGMEAAKLCGENALNALNQYIGDLNKIKRVLKINAYVASLPTFYDQPKVADGCSELFKKVFGEDLGVGARTAIGVPSLPGNIPVEVEFIFELEDQ